MDDDDRDGEEEDVVVDGKLRRGLTADDGVGGGASCALACVFRVVGESVSCGRREGRRVDGREGAREVCKESLGRLGVGGDVGSGMTESMVLATFLRSSEVWGLSSRCVLEV